MSLQLPQDRVVADRRAEPSHQALARTAAGAMAQQTDNLRKSVFRISGTSMRYSFKMYYGKVSAVLTPPSGLPFDR